MKAAPLEIDVFGRGALRSNGVHIPMSRDLRAILAYLSIAPGAVARAALIDDLWPATERSVAQQIVRRTVHACEHKLAMLAPHVGRAVISERRTLALSDAVRACVDVVRFRRLAGDGSSYEAALACYRPDFAAGLDDEWAIAARAQLAREHRAALERSVEAAKTRGDLATALRLLRALRVEAPFDERLLCDEMRLLEQTGSRAGALETYRRFASALRENYDADPSQEARDAYDRLRRRSDARARSLPAEVDTFFGRERELATVAGAFAGGRALTVTGIPGAGKTRLALRAAAQLEARFADGAIFIDAARLSDADAERALAQLHDERDVLVVIDGCERLVAAARVASDLLAANPHLHLIATARAPLGYRGERTLALGPLDPEAAAALFDERRAGALSQRDASDAGLTASRRVIEAAGPYPAPLERAAVRMRSMNAAELAPLLERDPSYVWPPLDELLAGLSALARRAYLDLSVFEAGWSFSGARAVVDASVGEAEHITERGLRDAIAELAEGSLIELDETTRDEQRFRHIPQLRTLARIALGSGQLRAAREGLVAYYVALFGELSQELKEANAGTHYGRLAEDLPNVRAALRAAISEGCDVAGGVTIAVALARFAGDRGYVAEFDALLQAALADHRLTGAARVDALEASARFALYLGDFARSYRGLSAVIEAREGAALANVRNSLAVAARSLGRHEEALGLARLAADAFAALGDLASSGKAASSIATTLLVLDRVDASRRAFEEALSGYERAGAILDAAHTLVNVAVGSYFAGDLDAARRYNDRALVAAAANDLVYVEALARNNAALFDVAEGNIASAIGHSRIGLQLCRRIEDPEAIANAVAAGAYVLLYAGDAPLSAFGLGASEAALERLGASRIPLEERFVANWLSRLTEVLGPARRDASITAGRAESLEAAGSTIEAGLAAMERSSALMRP